MPIPEWLVSIVFFAIIILPLAYMFVVLNSLSEQLFARKMQTEIDKVLINIFNTFSKNKNYEQCCYELEIVRARLSNASPVLKKKYDSISAIVEHFLLNLERGKLSSSVDYDTIKDSIFDFINRYKISNPLDQLKGANYSLLKELVETNDSDKRLGLVNQIAMELKSNDEMVTGLLLKNRTSTILAWVGIALTVVFGLATLF